ncbi:MAG: sodium:solute symporter [Acutalibacteraceae bacterium]|nr:sodium:solute symporter [Acutalibacteraceae bacterium]
MNSVPLNAVNPTTVWIAVPMLICFFALMIGVGIACRKHAANVDGFVLGGRNVGPWLTAFAFGTSYFSAVIFVGYAGQFGWNFGLASTWIGLGNAFIGSLLAWSVLGRRTRVMTQHLGSKTMPDFFEKRYDSKKLKVAASFIVFVFLIPYTASLYNGLSSLFNNVFAVPYWLVVIVMAVLTGVYVIFGGYMATAINDFIQGIIMLVGIMAVICSVLGNNGGFTAAVKALSESKQAGPEYISIFGPNPIFLFFVVMLTSLGTWGLPQMVGKFYSIKDEGSIKKGTVISTVFAIVVAGGCYFLGGFGKLYYSDMLAGGFISDAGAVMFDKVIPTMLSDLAPVIVSLIVVLVLAASMSTLSSLVLTSSSTLTLDVVNPYLSKKNKINDKKSVFIMRMFIVFFIAISAVIAILKDSVWKDSVFIAQMMGVSWGALAGAFLAPFLYGLYWKKTTRAAVVTSFIFGTGLEIIQLCISVGWLTVKGGVLGFVFTNSLYSGVFAMVGGLILVPIVSAFTQKTLPQNVEDKFSCYDVEVITNKKDSLG